MTPHARPETDAVAKAADALYASPLDAFVERRRALANELGDAGDRAGAKQVGAMGKPSVSAWVVNHLWWTERGAFEALFAAAEALRRSPDARPAFDAEVRAMRERAREVLAQSGRDPPPALLRRVSTTLHALAVAGGFAPDAAGRLVADREAPGFEAMEDVAWPARATPEVKSARARPVRTARSEDAERRAAAALAREIEALRNEAAEWQGKIAAAERVLAAVAVEQAKLDEERGRLEAAKALAEREATRVQSRVAAIDRSLRGNGGR